MDKLAGDATQECLDRNVLADLKGNTKILVSNEAIGQITTTLKLPFGFSCDHCVLQVKIKRYCCIKRNTFEIKFNFSFSISGNTIQVIAGTLIYWANLA